MTKYEVKLHRLIESYMTGQVDLLKEYLKEDVDIMDEVVDSMNFDNPKYGIRVGTENFAIKDLRDSIKVYYGLLSQNMNQNKNLVADVTPIIRSMENEEDITKINADAYSIILKTLDFNGILNDGITAEPVFEGLNEQIRTELGYKNLYEDYNLDEDMVTNKLKEFFTKVDVKDKNQVRDYMNELNTICFESFK